MSDQQGPTGGLTAALVRPVGSMLWELRGAWATGKRVALSLDERCDPSRAEGWVSQVAATGAFVKVGHLHVPAEAILAVHLPSRLGDSDVAKNDKFHGRGHVLERVPGQEELEMI